jgi:hypothetical protein
MGGGGPRGVLLLSGAVGSMGGGGPRGVLLLSGAVGSMPGLEAVGRGRGYEGEAPLYLKDVSTTEL